MGFLSTRGRPRALLALGIVAASAVAAAQQRAYPQRDAQEPKGASAREEAPLPPLTRVDGSWAVHARTRVVFPGLPDRPHTLTVDLAFPRRGRWMLAAEDAGEDRRVLAYRCGEQAWTVPVGSSTSEALGDRRLEEMRLTLALRRALLVGEHEYTWRADGLLRVATLPGGGKLRATLTEDGERPSRLEVLDAEGRPWEALVDLTWSEDGRSPRSWTLVAGGGATIWTEALEQLDRTRRYRSSFFVPPDRRERRATASATVVETLRLPARAELILPLEDWPAAAEVMSARESAARSLPEGRLLQAGHGVLLDARGRPAGLLLEVDGEAPAAAWRARPSTLARAARLPAGHPPALGGALRRLPPEGPGGRLVAWFRPGEAGELRREAVPD